MRSLLLIGCFFTLLGGCSTCLTANATYDEVWQATNESLDEELELNSISTPLAPRRIFSEGTIQATIAASPIAGEITYLIEIRPVGGEEPEDHDVCIRVLETEGDPRIDTTVKTARRPNLEQRLEARVAQRLLPPPEES